MHRRSYLRIELPQKMILADKELLRQLVQRQGLAVVPVSYTHLLFSILFAEGFIAAGLMLAFYAGLKPGGTIVLLGVGCLLVILAGKTAAAHFARRKRDTK